MTFDKEADFEDTLIKVLHDHYGWDKDVLKYPNEKTLLANWAKILFENNRSIDKLNDYPLTDGEMQQLMEKIKERRSPLLLNKFINGKEVPIIRDNPQDTLHFGKEVSLKIYDRMEIAGGKSRYQIAEQPQFAAKSTLLPERRGDFMLLINGMPVIHVELKKSGVPVSKAYDQIEKYSHEGIFTGLFSLVQIFVAMSPDETVYFANPGPDGVFNHDYYFHWADVDNEPINDWKEIAEKLLSIPMAHQLIGFYTVADDTDGILKVMRSYQYYAANAISDRVARTDWHDVHLLGGYIWHTTGSGKTMTSFKSAQLIANSKFADKVVFLVDRIELGTQSLADYQGFANDEESVQATEDTNVLITKLKSDSAANTLIVTSIQKMSNIKEDTGKAKDLKLMRSKKIVFIIDECHRSTFGDRLITIKKTFPGAIFFGFTGTPIQDENQKKNNTTTTVFGNELHRYSIADGIRDKNVLGFDPYRVSTYKDVELRKAVALEKAKAKDEKEALSDAQKRDIYYSYMDASKVKMAGYIDQSGKHIPGIEDGLPTSQYDRDVHRKKVVADIHNNWLTLSHGGKFHALFATSSIAEAVKYYKMIKTEIPELKISALFDPSIEDAGSTAYKEDALVEIIGDYNRLFHQTFDLSSYHRMKKDIALRLAHKEPYRGIEKTPKKQLDLLVVVNQMLTGFDSKWVNTLYLDKLLEYEEVIQAFSRTNRLFGPEKPFGTIRYYRKPHTMENNIKAAVKLYSGERAWGLFAQKLPENLEKINEKFKDIAALFKSAGIPDFTRLPDNLAERGRFAKLFKELNDYLEAAKIQGFQWDKQEYVFKDEENGEEQKVSVELDETIYKILLLRYKELRGSGVGPVGVDVPYDIDGYLVEQDTGVIDADYMNSRFDKYFKLLHTGEASEDSVKQALDELHKSFASLNQEDQKYANIFLHDVERGDAELKAGLTLSDYIAQYGAAAKKKQIKKLADALGLDEAKLRAFMGRKVTEANIDEYNHFEELKATVDASKARAYFEKQEGQRIPLFKVNIKVDKLLREFIFAGGEDI